MTYAESLASGKALIARLDALIAVTQPRVDADIARFEAEQWEHVVELPAPTLDEAVAQFLARETPHEDWLAEQGIEYGRALNRFGFRTLGDATAFKLRWY